MLSDSWIAELLNVLLHLNRCQMDLHYSLGFDLLFDSPGWRFALFCGGELLESSICSVEMSSFVHCSMMLQEVEKVLCLLPGSAAMRN